MVQGPAVTYRAKLSGRALEQMHRLRSPAFDSLIEVLLASEMSGYVTGAMLEVSGGRSM